MRSRQRNLPASSLTRRPQSGADLSQRQLVRIPVLEDAEDRAYQDLDIQQQ
jgi:hypothetical protein